jgi:hypothetical protein
VTDRLLVLVLLAEAAVVLGVLLALVGRVAVTSRRRRRHADALRGARELLRLAVLGEAPPDRAVATLRLLPLDRGLAVLLELATSVGGAGLERLRQIAEAAGVCARARGWCRSRRWWRRLRGLRLLAQLGADRAALPRFLDDPHPAVRAAAADAVAPPVPPQVVARLLTMLDDPDTLCRFSATAALLRAGRGGATGVCDYLDADRVPQPVAALAVAVTLADPRFVRPALRHSTAADPAVRRGATALLARTGGDPVTARLTQLLGDPDAGVRAAAAEALGELGHWPAAAVLADALRDPAWDVRCAAAVTLRRLGPPGRLYLRRSTGSADPFAADIARQVLALPEGAMSVVR